MNKEFVEVLYLLAKAVPVISVLWLAIRYFLKKERNYVTKINELQGELRTNERETLTIMNKLTQTLDRVIEANTHDKIEILNELKNLSAHITRKINELKKEK